ncbi:MAG: cyclic nucleotide-binding domain-containing protein [Candidatus Dormibacteraeota bacterium]|nr:cyclic nucleotide-binding domain-containing protein [Candidatus Dormibacteraeota bacterium]
MRLVGQSRLAIWFGVGLILWGVPIALLSISAAAPLAILLLTVVGIGNAIEDVAGFSVLQRIAPDAVLARILGIFEALIRITGGLGSLAAGLLVSRLGSRASLVIVGAFLPLIVTITWRRLRHLDAVVQVPTGRIGLLQRSPLFAPLSMMALERLALRMHPEQVAAGTDIIAEGDPGSHFYIIEVGEVEVTYRASPVTRLGAGGHFGEIAILRATPRTASVRALSAVQLLRLESDDFLAAVSQHAGSASWLESNVASRLSRAGGG